MANPDLSTEFMLIADVVFKTVSVVGRLARRGGADDLADELKDLMDRTVEVIDLEQQMRREK